MLKSSEERKRDDKDSKIDAFGFGFDNI